MLTSSSTNHVAAFKSLADLLGHAASLQSLATSRKIEGIFGLRIAGFEGLYAIHERQPSGETAPFILQTPAVGIEVQARQHAESIIRTSCVRPAHTPQALEFARQAGRNDAEVFIHNLVPSLLHPRIHAGQWDTWALGYSASSTENAVQARRKVGGEKMSLICSELDASRPNFHPKNILFLGCGDGIEVSSFLACWGERTKDASITAIDQSAVALGKAQKLILESHSQHHVNFSKLDFAGISSLVSKAPFDLVIGIGIFDRETLRFNEAVNLATYLRVLVAQDGILATTAYGYELFEKRNYTDLGYSVFQSCVPRKLFTADNPALYLMTNSTASIKVTEDHAAARSNQLWR